MPEEEKTAKQVADESIKSLEEKSKGYLEGLSDKLSSAFWDKVKEFFTTVLALMWNEFIPTWKESVKESSDAISSLAARLADQETTAAISEALAKAEDPEVVLKELEALTKGMPVLGWISSAAHYILALAGLLTASVAGQMELATQHVFKKTKPNLTPLDLAILARYKDPTVKPEIDEILARLGFSDKQQELIWTAVEERLPPEEARLAFLREIISEDELDEVLRSHKLSLPDIKTIKELYQIIPPVSDLITMAVREVFTPEIVERFGQMEDFPADFAAWSEKQGLSTFWARAYWASHWALPSTMQGFEMLHRRVISDDDLDLLLRALDVMPFWRDKLKAISYRPLTRVDVRRMYALGVIDEDGVYNSYRDIGYNDDNAKLMTDFTIAYTTEREKELTKTDITSLFKRRVLEFDAAQIMLMDIGYSETNAGLILARAAYEESSTRKKEQIKYIKNAYVAGKISETESLNRLGKLDLPAAEISDLIESWTLARESKVKSLTLDNIKAFFQANIISVDELRTELNEIGYNITDTERFVRLFTKE